MDLRYGENPHQKAALYADNSNAGIAHGRQLQGKELSYNNLVDLQACWDLAQEFDKPAVAIIKHTNPLAASTADKLADAYRKALETDPVSAFGGVIGVNRPIDGETAAEMAKLFVEAIAAPGFDEAAREAFSKKKNLRLVEVTPAPPGPVIKNVSGGVLVQDPDVYALKDSELKVVSPAPAHAGRNARAEVRLDCLQAREVQRHRLCPRRTNGWRGRRPDEPR